MLINPLTCPSTYLFLLTPDPMLAQRNPTMRSKRKPINGPRVWMRWYYYGYMLDVQSARCSEEESDSFHHFTFFSDRSPQWRSYTLDLALCTTLASNSDPLTAGQDREVQVAADVTMVSSL